MSRTTSTHTVFTCDRCGEKNTYKAERISRPPGWHRVNILDNNGAQVSTEHVDLCGTCSTELEAWLVKVWFDLR